jgi:predicted transposase YdaD
VRAHAADYLSVFDAPPTLPVSLLNVDLSTVTTAADIVIGLGEPMREIMHLDFQASANATKHLDVLVYNALLHRHYQVPVHSILVLLRPQAAHPNTDGAVRYQARPGRGRMEFSYEVVRLWEKPAKELLAGALGSLPLAPLGRLPEGVSSTDGLAEVIQQLIERLQREAPAEQVRRLLTAAYILTGLLVPRDVALQLFRGVRAMQDSDTFQAILEEGEERGRLEEAKKILLRQGRKKLGLPDETVQTTLAAIKDLNRLEQLGDRLLDVSSWQELFASPE